MVSLKSKFHLARLDTLDMSKVSSRIETIQVEFGLYEQLS